MAITKLGSQLARNLSLIAVFGCGYNIATAASFTSTVFATGSAVNATQPDSITIGNGSLWAEYSNGASSTNYTGTSTIVQYSLAGAVQNTYSIPGSVDGLKYNPNTGQVWALQNQDANSRLSLINPATGTVITYNYGDPYPSISGSRGFDDVAFIGSNVYLSVTNPNAATDPVIVKLNNATPTTPVTFTTVLTGTGLLATDPDSLKSTPTGGLILTGEGDGALTFVANPGMATQTATSLKLSAAPGATIGSPDDALFATADSGTFYIADTATNTIYAIAASGLTPNSLFVSTATAFGSVDQTTGVVTPIITGRSLHGMEFVPSAAAVPEPSTFGISLAGFALGAVAVLRKCIAR
ncbi:MAG: PEP-CTERM sorting domain-containing protein [Acidobacteriaceae bacterium]|nr:PEP-CTERM sorting domain-containing protein [Acidobacteriaceae bacterium]